MLRDAVERGLIPIVRVRGRPSGPWTIEDRMRHHDVPGVQIAVIEGGEVAWTAGYGELERGSGRCVDERSRFQAASISKPVTALAVLRLVDRGALSLDQPVNERLRSWRVPENEFTVARPVTLRALLSHTAGTTVSGFPGYASGVELPSLRQILEGEPPANTPAVRVDSPVGGRFRYSGGGTTIVQLLLTEVVGQPFPELMRDLVLAPLGMRDSTFAQPLPSGLRASAATAHERGAPVSGGWNTYPEMAAAGLWTTAEDLGRFVIGLQQARRGARGSLLSPELAREMFTPPNGGPVGLGPAIEVEGRSIRFAHSGGNRGFSGRFVGDADRGQGAVVLTNADRAMVFVGEALNAVGDVAGWPDYVAPERDTSAVPAATLARYVGSYRSAELGTIAIRIDGDRLYARLPWSEDAEMLASADRSFFFEDSRAEAEFGGDALDRGTLTLRQGDQTVIAVREGA